MQWILNSVAANFSEHRIAAKTVEHFPSIFTQSNPGQIAKYQEKYGVVEMSSSVHYRILVMESSPLARHCKKAELFLDITSKQSVDEEYAELFEKCTTSYFEKQACTMLSTRHQNQTSIFTRSRTKYSSWLKFSWYSGKN